ncbi:MAG: metallophosphoesterase [Oscillospiraceae bacterium]|nr:metallophosphoesterase [Oscillospiraceae bacterium]
MMKLLVLSDSHSALSFMRRCIEALKPDVVAHLGDHYDDGAAMAEEFPHIRFYQVPGNCDRYRCDWSEPQILVPLIGGVRIFITHGHLHGVKSNPYRLINEAKKADAAAVLFGHTHEACCFCKDNLWVVNPGSCGYYGGSVALIQIEKERISDCRILRQSDIQTLIEG